ncbi:MAG: glutamate 5-kinase [Deltaproteobacteria bacterium]|nr:glutamate 5-kinase [Deltaproteobacteria bacterium]
MDRCDWQAEKARALAGARTVTVKVGSSVLTSRTDQGLILDLGILRDLASQLAALRQRGLRVVLVSSGAVAAGRTALEKEIHDLAGRQAAAAVGQGRLMRHYEEAFAGHGLLTAQVLLTRDDLRDRGRFLNIRNTFAHLLDWGVVPIVNENDTVSVSELKFSDNDNLASLLLNVVEADVFVNLTSIGGVLDKNPLEHPQAVVMPYIGSVRDLDLDALCGGKTSVGTGGMYTKLLAARRAAQLGVPTFILPGRDPGVILAAFAGSRIGTWVRPGSRISRRKYWLAYRTEPKGVVRIDDGAAKAVSNRGGSLLPGGVLAVEGEFKAGDPVRIMHQDQVVGVGLSNYDHASLDRIKGLKRHEVAVILGDAHYPEVVHRDNLLRDAAV